MSIRINFSIFQKLLFRIANRGEQNRNFDYILWAVALNLFLQHWSYLKFCGPNFSSFTNVLKIYFLNDQRTAHVCTKSFELFLQGAKNIKDNIQTNKQWRSRLKHNWHLCTMHLYECFVANFIHKQYENILYNSVEHTEQDLLLRW